MRLILEGTDTTEKPANQTQPSVTVELPGDELTVREVVDFLVRPALLAAGYAEGSVNEVLPERDA